MGRPASDHAERHTPRGMSRLDWTGFLTLSAAISCVQLVLARGQRLDWFESPEIVVETVLAATALFMFVAHTLTAERPFLDPKLLTDPNYALGLVLVTIYGMLNFTPVVLLPSLLQQYAGYPDQIIGGILGARGVGATIGFFLAMFVGKLDPRIGMSFGFSLLVASGWWLMSLDLNVGMTTLALNSVLQGIGIGVFWVPLTISTFADAGDTAAARGDGVVSSAAQHRLQLFHFGLCRRDRARDRARITAG